MHLAGVALTVVVTAGFTCIQPPPPPPPNQTQPTTDTDASAAARYSGQAAHCGDVGEACCADPNNRCNGRTNCEGETCVPCGVANASACASGAACDEGTLFDGDSTTCVRCGGNGDLCCVGSNDTEYCNDAGVPLGCFTDHNVSRCSPCANAMMCPVIRPRTPDAGLATLCGQGFVRADAGVCVACGSRAGMPCCRNNNCAFPLSCSDRGVCVTNSCGGLRQPCCRNNRCVIGRCNAGTCTR